MCKQLAWQFGEKKFFVKIFRVKFLGEEFFWMKIWGEGVTG